MWSKDYLIIVSSSFCPCIFNQVYISSVTGRKNRSFYFIGFCYDSFSIFKFCGFFVSITKIAQQSQELYWLCTMQCAILIFLWRSLFFKGRVHCSFISVNFLQKSKQNFNDNNCTTKPSSLRYQMQNCHSLFNNQKDQKKNET